MENEPLKGKVFVFTGEMSIDRDDARTKVVVLGGRCTTTPSSRTTFLVAGGNPGPLKMQRARELGIRVLSEDEFKALIGSGLEALCRAEGPRKEESNAANGGSGPSDVWSEKYRPKDKEEIVGNAGVVKQLEDYLKGLTKHRAALLSGHPGVGKTTAAHVVCRSLGLDAIEFNASDVRSRAEISSRVRGLVNTRSVVGWSGAGGKVLIMDEVDGMSGDRGGVAELVSIIKEARVPIVCICNDRNNPRMRTLASYCLDLRFRRPDSRQVLSRIKWILGKEGRSVPEGFLSELVVRGGGDMRYTIGMVQSTVLRKAVGMEAVEALVKKHVMKSVFDVAAEVFQRRTVAEKIDLYFEDYSLVPLFVSENVPKASCKSIQDLSECLDSISLGDVVEKLVRGPRQDWSLAPLHAVYGVVIPTHGRLLTRRMDFPSWLGQNSRHLKAARALHTVSMHLSCKVRTSQSEIRKYALELVLRRYAGHLKTRNVEGALEDMVDHDMTKEDMAGLGDVMPWGADAMKGVERGVKVSLDREYKKLRRRLPYTEVERDKHRDDESREEGEELPAEGY